MLLWFHTSNNLDTVGDFPSTLKYGQDAPLLTGGFTGVIFVPETLRGEHQAKPSPPLESCTQQAGVDRDGTPDCLIHPLGRGGRRADATTMRAVNARAERARNNFAALLLWFAVFGGFSVPISASPDSNW